MTLLRKPTSVRIVSYIFHPCRVRRLSIKLFSNIVSDCASYLSCRQDTPSCRSTVILDCLLRHIRLMYGQRGRLGFIRARDRSRNYEVQIRSIIGLSRISTVHLTGPNIFGRVSADKRIGLFSFYPSRIIRICTLARRYSYVGG